VTPSTPKAFIHLAREAPVGVVLYRRSRLTTYVLKLDHMDRLHKGSRFYGRLFPERCDLSPDGKLFVYFAMRGRKTGESVDPATWTAVCSPPWLKAHLFCPNGSTWGGGGLFLRDHRLAVIDRPENPDMKEVGGYRLVRDNAALSNSELELLRLKVRPAKESEFSHPAASATILRRLKDGVASGYDQFDYDLRNADGAEFPGAEDIILAHWAGWDVHGRLMAATGSKLRIYEVERDKPLPRPAKILDLETAINGTA
jgi:hypothetical protein